jgi:glycine/D-amino acid oxidase-like deaminating enzyme
LSARGYAVQVDGRHWVIGSTYEHEFKDVDPDPLFDAYLIDRFKAMFPQPLDIKVMARWSGIRVGSFNRAPIFEAHPSETHHLALTALGSKGLLYSQVLGKQVAEHVLNSI